MAVKRLDPGRLARGDQATLRRFYAHEGDKLAGPGDGQQGRPGGDAGAGHHREAGHDAVEGGLERLLGAPAAAKVERIEVGLRVRDRLVGSGELVAGGEPLTQ